jgi:hypothetical protein
VISRIPGGLSLDPKIFVRILRGDDTTVPQLMCRASIVMRAKLATSFPHSEAVRSPLYSLIVLGLSI